MIRRISQAFLLVLIALMAGCTASQNDAAPKTATVSGTVFRDGKPMSSGEVRFSMIGQPPLSCEIKDGKFSGASYVGKNQVEVVLEEDGPPSTTEPDEVTKINVIAEEFSGPSTTLSAEVAKEGASELKFEVTSK